MYLTNETTTNGLAKLEYFSQILFTDVSGFDYIIAHNVLLVSAESTNRLGGRMVHFDLDWQDVFCLLPKRISQCLIHRPI